jgi:hypothetical protein
VALALEAKGNPAIVEMKTKSRTRGFEAGEARGLAEAILLAFESRDVTLEAENRQSILDCQDTALLKRWLIKALDARSTSEILTELERI